MEKQIYSIPTLKRLPSYLRELSRLQQERIKQVSSPQLAKLLHVDSITVRKDLEIIKVPGRTGVGYPVGQLLDGIQEFLGWKNTSEVFLVGLNELGRALLGYSPFTEHGLKIIAAFDHTIDELGQIHHSVPLFPLTELRHLTERLKIKMAILCVSDQEAQETAELLEDAGIMAIWNFTQHTLQVSERVLVQRVNLAGDLAVLSVKLRDRLQNEFDEVDQQGKDRSLQS